MVGLSDDRYRESHKVASYLQDHGYRVVPVNPNVNEVLGEKSYPTLADIPFEVDAIDVFRRSEFLAEIVDEAIAKGVSGIWTQLGVYDRDAIARAQEAGLSVVVNRCWMTVHMALRGRP